MFMHHTVLYIFKAKFLFNTMPVLYNSRLIVIYEYFQKTARHIIGNTVIYRQLVQHAVWILGVII